MRRLVILAIVMILLLSPGCCKFTDGNQTQPVKPNITVNKPPIVELKLNASEGSAPFDPSYTYKCYDPEDDLVSCEIRIDGQTFASGTNQNELFPEDYTYPEFYEAIIGTVGVHSLEIRAIDGERQIATKEVNFTVLKGARLIEPGWYNCNGITNPPCDIFQQYYCDKFNPTDMEVRKAASQAISKHPGAFSINQILDVYDWVHSNVFYQNVPISMWPPYYPNETLKTGSGDCKNQAVLIASMIEAIGGSARVLYIPECRHAFAEVYVGDDADTDALNNAVWAHYPQASDKEIHWHTSKNANDETENWFILDTAGGWFPGDTILDCLNASQTFALRDCEGTEELNAPEIRGTEYGPNIRVNDSQVIQPGWGYHYWLIPTGVPDDYEWCHYRVFVESHSRLIDWYVVDEEGYQGFNQYESFRYYYGEEQVQSGFWEFDWTKPDKFYIAIRNSNEQYSATVRTQVIETCYKGG
ncbi:Transglutaminase-like superfamily protein [Candidatus Bilamarchaeum dharawalense]|uniref:Transglutaminase-like superfamily protein n=1 Tax=Candidatus Bilamarchaeum dharawalense TaxID=2885759 RepID=A0A5E4LSP1_9ARCH|nr:Transglutaminase-like superfamily protein [Candidatus Bilamarchaeum dharawalense]